MVLVEGLKCTLFQTHTQGFFFVFFWPFWVCEWYTTISHTSCELMVWASKYWSLFYNPQVSWAYSMWNGFTYILSSVLDSWLFFLTFVVFFSCLWLFSPSLLVFTLPINLPQEWWVCVVCGRGRKKKGEREEETNLSLPETNYRELNILQLTNELCSKLWPPDKIYHTIFSLEPVQIFFTFYLTHSQCNWLLVHMKFRWLSYLL